jgi:hypothetical protein
LLLGSSHTRPSLLWGIHAGDIKFGSLASREVVLLLKLFPNDLKKMSRGRRSSLFTLLRHRQRWLLSKTRW